MAIVTISYEMGAGGPSIGATLARRLDYRYVDREVIVEAARRHGFAEERVSALDEKKLSLFERFDSERRKFVAVIQTVLLDFAEEDRVVLMGRGGQWLLRGVPHALRVRVMAPMSVRIERVREESTRAGAELVDPGLALDMVQRDDAEKIGRMRYLFEVDLRDPVLYDVTINTEMLSPAAAVDHLARLIEQPEFTASDAARQLVADRGLAARVVLALAADRTTCRARVKVTAERGVVVLGGSGLSRAAAVARTVPGVREVKIQPRGLPPAPPV